MSLAVREYFFLENRFPYLADSFGLDRWIFVYKISVLSLPQGARKESKRKTRNTQHTQKGRIKKVVFLVRKNCFRATLERRKTETSFVKVELSRYWHTRTSLYLTSA